jgi:copper oxidase (laccase) domain-containing protein
VGPEVAAHFWRYFPDAKNLTHVDLAEANFRQLVSAGITAQFIDRSGLCTVCDARRFHSFRRDKHSSGRMVAAIAIQE